MKRIKSGPQTENKEFLVVQAQLIGMKNTLREKGVLEPHSITYGLEDIPNPIFRWTPLDARDPTSQYRKVPDHTEWHEVHSIPFTKDQADFYFQYRISDFISLSIEKQGSAGVFSVEKYDDFVNKDFEELYEYCKTPRSKSIVMINTSDIQNQQQLEQRQIQEHLEEMNKRTVV
jgi:hypothetical protein